MPPQQLTGVIDLGGTKIYTAVLGEHDRILGDDLRATEAGLGCDAVLDRIAQSLTESAAKAGVDLRRLAGAAIAAPGPVIAGAGRVVNPPNLPGWGDVALGPMLSNKLGLQVAVENDANAAALGEYLEGAGREARTLVYVTVSTGVGGGFVIGGELYRGPRGAAGEIGHMVIRPGGPLCGCGNNGCLEALASGTALAREGHEALRAGRAPLLRDLLAGSGGELTAELVARAAGEGDPDAAAIINNAGKMLGVGLANLVNLLDPDVIVIGGGASKIGEPFLGPAKTVMQELSVPAARAEFRLAELDYAAIIGLSGLARRVAR